MDMPGIQFMVDPSGQKTAVVIDLKTHADLWEDFYDGLVAESRRNEPTVSIDEMKRKIDAGSD